MSTKQGRRATSGMIFLSSEMLVLAPSSTNPLAKAKPTALATLLLTASNGHNPSSWAQAGLFSIAPRLKSLFDTGVLLLVIFNCQLNVLSGLLYGPMGNGRANNIVQFLPLCDRLSILVR
jgi:hypothetical protein